MRRLVSSLFFILTLGLGIGAASADYFMPEPDYFFGEEKASFSVVVLEVDRFEGSAAHVTVHEQIVGEFDGSEPVEGVVYTCFGHAIEEMGVADGQRYAMLLLDAAMAEEQSYFPVDDADMVDLRSYADWFGFDEQTVPLAAFRDRVAELAK